MDISLAACSWQVKGYRQTLMFKNAGTETAVLANVSLMEVSFLMYAKENYFFLFPGEEKKICIQVKERNWGGLLSKYNSDGTKKRATLVTGCLQFIAIRMESAMYRKKKELLAQICHLLYARNLVTACDGNVSLRVSGEHILITPSGKNKGFVTAEEILTVDYRGNCVEGEGKASKEFPLHRTVYQLRPKVNAVIHTHPVYATAFAMTGKNIPDNYLVESKVMLGRLGLAQYAPPGTEALAENMAPFVMECDAVLLKNHGAVTYGEALMDAFNKMEVLESIAKTIIVSKAIGEGIPISQE